MNVVAYTAVFNDYDILRGPHRRNESVRYVCISDRPVVRADGWEIVTVDLPMRGHPYAQRFHKILSHRVFPDADVTLYLDGTFQLLVDPLQMVDGYLKDADLALFRHPRRTDVYEELEACAALSKDDPGLLQLVAERYAREGMPGDSYVHSAGVILRRHTPEVAAFNEDWFDELVQTGIRDQPALAHSLWKTGISVEVIDADIRDNAFVRYYPHKAKLQRPKRQFLFIGGNPRSGTTALCELLNHDPRIVLGMERYRKIRTRITPEHFTSEVFFAPTEMETSYLPARLISPDRQGFKVWPADESALKKKWDTRKLVYVGDKAPFYIRQLPYLRETFPGARFIVTIRDPVSVADSYQRRAADATDHWPSANDYTLAIEHWNRSLRNILRYLERFGLRDIFLVDYDGLFSGDRNYLRSLYRFLELEVTSEVSDRFEALTAGWDARTSRLPILDETMEAEVRASADWESYSRIKRLLPLMQDYDLLASERKAWARSDAFRAEDTVAYRDLHNLSRYIYMTLSELGREGPAAGSRATEAVESAEQTWRTFWDL